MKIKKIKYRVYANYGKGDTNKFGFTRLEDAKKMAHNCRKHKGCKWATIYKRR